MGADGSDRRTHTAPLLGRANEERALLQLIEAVRAGESRVLVISGEPGVGKSALLDHLAARAAAADCRVARAFGVESEVELAYAGLHQLCRPMLNRVDHLPAPQKDALETALGLRAGPPPDRFLVGLAALSLLSDVAAERPLVCIVDDRQWIDTASTQAMEFVARRLAADSVGFVVASRDQGDALTKFPRLVVQGLSQDDARALLDSVLVAPLDGRVRDRIVAETRGNPLALLELPRGFSPAELAGGFGLPDAQPLSGRIQESFERQIEALPELTRRLLRLAAADSSGDPLMLWRAAEFLGISAEAVDPALEVGLLDFGTHVQFRHPLVRSAAYRSASLLERRELHGALAAVTDRAVDPDRRAWHLAQVAAGPDETVALELEVSAGRAQRRGGMAAAAAFLERAALLTPDPARRRGRLLAAAQSKSDAGDLDAAMRMLVSVEAGPIDTHTAAELELLRGRIALERRHGNEAAQLLLGAARSLEVVSLERAREAYLDALIAALWASYINSPLVCEAGTAARRAPPAPHPQRPIDELLDALALRVTDGYASGAASMRRALEVGLALNNRQDPSDRWLWFAGGRIFQMIAMDLWDDQSWHALATGHVDLARTTGAMMHLNFALHYLARIEILSGNLTAADRLVEEDRLMAQATGRTPIADTAMLLAAWRGEDQRALHLIEATANEAKARGAERLDSLAAYAGAILHNGFGRSALAFEAAVAVFEREPIGYGSHVAPELAEAAARVGDDRTLAATLDWLNERVRATPTAWARGVELRVRAFSSGGRVADACYRESIQLLSQTRIRLQLARGHLVYGEWLRRENRRADARDQLRTAYELLIAMGANAFAARAGRELRATGETVHRAVDVPSHLLTAQEHQVALLARDGLSNPEIGARLFVSPRTAQYHLKKVFTKLGITSRTQLHLVLPGDNPETSSRRSE
jgi:DNA-binding CsgD family transcriptional regulator